MTKKHSFFNRHSGFTLVELMIVLALASIAFAAYMQTVKQEAMQLQARKLGSQELYVYNSAVQKFLLENASANPASITGTYNGVDWLKSTSCPSGTGTAPTSYLNCNFLSATGGLTTIGNMSFTTTVTYSASATATHPKGFQARTVLSKMATLDPGETGAGRLGLAAMVASAAFLGPESGASNDPGTVIYCPDLSPFPSSLSSFCGAQRDQIVMYGYNNRSNDIWLRVDHGNTVKNVIEAKSPGSTTMDPSSSSAIDAIDSRNNRHLRNFSRIYNLGPSGDNSGDQNLYLGKRQGDSAIGSATIANNGVIVDADQEVLGYLTVQGTIDATDDISTDQDLNADQNLNVGNNATINGWVRSDESRTSRLVDTDDNNYLVDPSTQSVLNEVLTTNVEAMNLDLNLTADQMNLNKKSGSGDVILNGEVDVSNLQVRKRGELYSLEELLPNLTLIGSTKLRHGQGVSDSSIDSQCGGPSNVRVYIQPLVDEIVTNENVGAQVRFIKLEGGQYKYKAKNPYRTSGSQWATNAEAIVMFYCNR